MTIKVTYNVTDVYVTQDVSPVYINISYSSGGGSGAAVWGSITGTLSDQTDLQTALDGKFDDPTGTTAQYLRGDGSLATFPSLTGYVPYTGATANVDLGTHTILAQNATISSSGSGDTTTITHSSGSGIGLNITKGGNGEGLYINKTSGSGNAATIIGTLNATTIIKSGGTSSQFLKADGTVDSSVYVPTSTTLTINGVTYDLSANRTFSVGSVTGSGASGQVAYWTGTSAQSGSNNLFWDATNSRLGIGTNVPSSPLHIVSSALVTALYVNTGNDGGFTAQNNGTLSVNRTTQVRLVNGSTIFGANDRTYQLVNIGRNSTEADFYIQYWNGSSYLDRFRLFSTGNFGIGTGTTDSGERLQVTGTMKVTGASTISNTLTVGDSTTGGLKFQIAANYSTHLRVLCTSTLDGFTGTIINSTLDFQSRDLILAAKSSSTTSNVIIIPSTYTQLQGNVGINNAPTSALDVSASTTTRASLRIRSGTAPTSPNDGDIWFDGTDIKMRIGGVTKTFTLI